MSAVLALGLALAGCATAGGGGPSPTPPDEEEPPREEPAEPEATDGAADAALDEVTRLVEAGRHREAALLADSLYFRARSRPGLSRTAADALRRQARALEAGGDLEAAADRLRELLDRYPESAGGEVPARLAGVLVERADDPGAAGVLLRRPGNDEGAALDLARRAARGMSAAELEDVLDADAAAGGNGATRAAVRAALLAELAVARARAGRAGDARAAARRALESDPAAEDADRARSVLEGSIGPREGPVRIGLLLPGSGRLAPVGDRLREGVELAVEAHGDGLPPVEITSVDSGEEGAEIPRLVERLEEEGVAAVIGPVRSGELGRAASGRSDPGLLILSPTAGAAEPEGPAVYTLREETRREVDAAREVGRWMAGVLGRVPVGAVYPDDATGRRAYLAFRGALGAGESWVAAAHPYDTEATTLEGPITAVSAFAPRAVFAPGGSGASVLQMAPQLSYYGVRGAIVAGGPSWSRPSTVRRLEPSFSQHRIVATSVDRGDASGGWERFREAYERTHRRSVPDNMLPALSHDAALVVLRALRDVPSARPRAVARRAAAVGPVDGATGRLRLDPATGTAERATLVRALRDRELVPASAGEARDWLTAADPLETARSRSRRQRAEKAVRESGVELESPDDGGR